MPPAKKTTHVRCKDGFVLPDRTVVKTGQVVLVTSRVAKAAPDNFEPYTDEVVEQATRAPGERRVLPNRDDRNVVIMSAAAKRNLRLRALPADSAAVTEAEGKAD